MQIRSNWLAQKRAYEAAASKLDVELCGDKRMRGGGGSHRSLCLSDFASQKGTSSPRLIDFASAVGSKCPSHTSSRSKGSRSRCATAQQPGAIQGGVLRLKDMEVPVEQVLEALSKVKCSTTVATMCGWTRSLGGTVPQVPALQGSFGNLRKRATTMWKTGQNFQIVHCHREKTHRAHALRQEPSKCGCSTCGRLWRRFSILQICLEDDIALDCQGFAARKRFLSILWFPQSLESGLSVRDAFRKAFKMTKKEASLMELSDATARAARKRFGLASSCMSIHTRVEAARKRRSTVKKFATGPAEERSRFGAQTGASDTAPASAGSGDAVASSQFSWTCEICTLTLPISMKGDAEGLGARAEHHPHLRQRDAKKVPKFKGQFLWRRDACQAGVLGANLRAIQHQRNGHILMEHPGVPKTSFSTLTGKRGRANISTLDQD